MSFRGSLCGVSIMESIHAYQLVSNYTLGDWSRDPYIDKAKVRAIQAWCDATFGTHTRPCAYMTNLDGQQRLFAHPAIIADMRSLGIL